jgi:hypothetical protein
MCGIYMNERKYIWIGQRISDALLFMSNDIFFHAFFVCEEIVLEDVNYHQVSKIYSLARNGYTPQNGFNWSSSDIIVLVKEYQNVINEYLNDGYYIFAYYFPSGAYELVDAFGRVLNHEIFNRILQRSNQMDLMNSYSIRTPKWMPSTNLEYKQISSAIGIPFILQYDYSSSGLGTFLITSEADYVAVRSNKTGGCIAAEYIDNGISCTAHLYISKDNYSIISPSEQLINKTLHKEVRSVCSFNYMGNDFSEYRSIDPTGDAYNFLCLIACAYQKSGYSGILGVDYILKEGMFYYTETNFRLQNSTALLSFLQPNDDNNIINGVLGEMRKFDHSLINNGFQIYFSTTNANLRTGFYSYEGRFIGDYVIDFSKNLDERFLLFCAKESGKLYCRLIGNCDDFFLQGQMTSLCQKYIEGLVAKNEY